MAAESRTAVFAAIAGNLVIAVIKFVAAAFTGSSAMISEGIHSVVDTGNGVLLYLGITNSEKPADEEHPFGHGRELYFWSLIVAISIFGVGGGMSVYEGITHIQHPSALENPALNYIVLAISALVEGASFAVAYRSFTRAKGEMGTWRAIRTGKDPSLFTVVFEDAAAMLGLVVAFAGVFFGHLLENPYIDGAASIGIGLILMSVALLLAYESKGLLVGESADPGMVEDIRRIVLAEPDVSAVGAILTMHLGPADVLLNLDVEFSPRISAEEAHHAIDRIEDRVRETYPAVRRIYVEAESLTGPNAHKPENGKP